VARLLPGTAPLRPQIDVPQEGLLTADQRDRVRDRLARWMGGLIEARLAPLLDPLDDGVSGPARGLLFQLTEALGTLPTAQARTQIDALSPEDRKALARLGVRLGWSMVYVPRLFKPAAQRLRAILWSLYRRSPAPAQLPDGRMSAACPDDLTADLAMVLGYRLLRDGENGNRLIRVDGWEQASAALRQMHRQGQKEADGGVTQASLGAVFSPLGLPAAQREALCTALGWRLESLPQGLRLSPLRGRSATAPRPQRAPRPVTGPRRQSVAEDTPFAVLRDHALAQPATPPPKPKKPRRKPKPAESKPTEAKPPEADGTIKPKKRRRRKPKTTPRSPQ
jgi:ATP-dependent RNA helicase SUPV3L1/SUV3